MNEYLYNQSILTKFIFKLIIIKIFQASGFFSITSKFCVTAKSLYKNRYIFNRKTKCSDILMTNWLLNIWKLDYLFCFSFTWNIFKDYVLFSGYLILFVIFSLTYVAYSFESNSTTEEPTSANVTTGGSTASRVGTASPTTAKPVSGSPTTGRPSTARPASTSPQSTTPASGTVRSTTSRGTTANSTAF